MKLFRKLFFSFVLFFSMTYGFSQDVTVCRERFLRHALSYSTFLFIKVEDDEGTFEAVVNNQIVKEMIRKALPAVGETDLYLAINGIKPIQLKDTAYRKFFHKVSSSFVADSIYKSEGIEGIRKRYLKGSQGELDFAKGDVFAAMKLLFMHHYLFEYSCFYTHGGYRAKHVDCSSMPATAE